ncbi:MAG: sigma-70 family RNA polymerase sigma factor [Gammaproteobacteria bacterium]|nr:sigma-70 family RNA polymerase sigma factor [Gammaproteobacteria bacterium]
MTNQATDEQLIRWFRKGNPDAFEQLYTRYKNAVYHYFYRQVQSPGIADELHQDVWLNIIKSSSVFTRRSSFKTWLYKIAHNRLVDHYRRISKQPLHLLQETVSEPEAGTEDYLSQHTGPDTMLQEQQLSLALLDAIALLPREQKEVFLLYEKNGLTLQEIATITDSSYESAKSRLRYAVKKLRQHLAKHLIVEL